MKVSAILNSATMGKPEKLKPMIYWNIIEYFFRGSPYAVTLFIVWEVFKPLKNSNLELNITNITLALIGMFISLLILRYCAKKSYFASYESGYEICAEGRKDVISHLKKLPMGFYNKKDPGDIGAYIVHDYANIEQMTTHLVPQFFGALSMPILLLITLMFYNWKLALSAAAVIPLSLPMLSLTNYIVAKLGKKHQKTKVDAASRMIEYIQGIKIIKAFNLGGVKFERLEKAFRKLMSDSIKLEAAPGPTIIFASAILNSGLVLIILLGFSFLLSAEITLPHYILFLVFGVHIYQPMIHALTFLAEINYMTLGALRVEDLRNMKPLPNGKVGEIDKFDIKFDDVHFNYNNVEVLNSINLSIPEKSLTAFVGPSGSGKTTLTRLIARFWDANKGDIFVGSVNVKDYADDVLISKIAIVFQDVYLFNDTILNNIKIGREDATIEEVINAAKLARCHEFISNLPEKYYTVVGEGGNSLSGGEKQRISIARAILKDAPIILLDEATASLDPENDYHIQQAINELIKNKTVVMIAHKLNTIKNADKIVVIDKGKIVQKGRHDDLLREDGLYKNLWNEQQRIKDWKF
ncbi:MAG: ABC transporter ATP-binding protein [Candidatus Delongbacteria bacterium]|nr:ABC transporter ATP-binding protein [Candidatus Delongbacteria bacterium]MBN2833465.1 ABC transporter ATP-binding protein [Candidatus Delongbacteria bacterium]